MRYLRRRALRITVIPVGGPLITLVDRSSRIDENTSVGASDADNGFSMPVTTKPRPQTWMWAKVYFKSDTTVNDTFAVEYATTASTKPAELSSKLIRGPQRSRTSSSTDGQQLPTFTSSRYSVSAATLSANITLEALRQAMLTVRPDHAALTDGWAGTEDSGSNIKQPNVAPPVSNPELLPNEGYYPERLAARYYFFRKDA
jgi:predicted aminopeptidase